jgi:predicted lipoprotein
MKRAWVLFSFCLLGLLAACTIVPIAEVEQIRQSETFDPVSYVDGIWAEQVVPTMLEKATDLPIVLAAIATNLEDAGEDYATISQSGALNFVVRGQGVVQSVNTESRNGTAVLQIEGYDGPITVILQVGPLIRGDGVRDGVGFINFGDFREQTEFGQVARELNQRVADEIVSGLDLDNLAGKPVAFNGVFTIRTTNQTNIDLSEIVITPVLLEVDG